MRINVYSQEITEEIVKIQKEGTNAVGEAETFHAVRLMLHSSPRLHHNADDDDRSGVTFWLPKSKERREAMAKTFEAMAKAVREA